MIPAWRIIMCLNFFVSAIGYSWRKHQWRIVFLHVDFGTPLFDAKMKVGIRELIWISRNTIHLCILRLFQVPYSCFHRVLRQPGTDQSGFPIVMVIFCCEPWIANHVFWYLERRLNSTVKMASSDFEEISHLVHTVSFFSRHTLSQGFWYTV